MAPCFCVAYAARTYVLTGEAGPGVGLHLAHHAWLVVHPEHELESAFDAEMTRDGVILMALEHLHTASASCRNVQLHAIVEEAVVLLPMALVQA